MTSPLRPPPPTYTLVLMRIGPKPAWVIKEMRRLIDKLSIADARRMVASPPVILRAGLSGDDALDWADLFHDAGASVRLVEHAAV